MLAGVWSELVRDERAHQERIHTTGLPDRLARFRTEGGVVMRVMTPGSISAPHEHVNDAVLSEPFRNLF
jgi:hypothetical protein